MLLVHQLAAERHGQHHRRDPARAATARRQSFAIDLSRPQLIAVTDEVNQAKGDQDPSTWQPSRTSYRCTYSKMWIRTKYYWKPEASNLREIGTANHAQHVLIMTELSSTFTAARRCVDRRSRCDHTGALELHTTCTDDGSVTIRVRYVGALEWYTVTSSTGIRLHDPRDHDTVHALLVGILRHPRG